MCGLGGGEGVVFFSVPCGVLGCDQGGGEVIACGYMRYSLPFILTFVPVGGWINN